MEQFVVPQFIDVEDKVIGPITVRQFIILLVGAGFIFIAYKLSDFILFLIEFVVLASLTFSVAFIKVNGKPVHFLILNVIQTLRRPWIRVWQHRVSLAEAKRLNRIKEIVPLPPVVKKTKVRASRLAELSLIVDTGGFYQGENSKLPQEKLV